MSCYQYDDKLLERGLAIVALLLLFVLKKTAERNEKLSQAINLLGCSRNYYPHHTEMFNFLQLLYYYRCLKLHNQKYNITCYWYISTTNCIPIPYAVFIKPFFFSTASDPPSPWIWSRVFVKSRGYVTDMKTKQREYNVQCTRHCAVGQLSTWKWAKVQSHFLYYYGKLFYI